MKKHIMLTLLVSGVTQIDASQRNERKSPNFGGTQQSGSMGGDGKTNAPANKMGGDGKTDTPVTLQTSLAGDANPLATIQGLFKNPKNAAIFDKQLMNDNWFKSQKHPFTAFKKYVNNSKNEAKLHSMIDEFLSRKGVQQNVINAVNYIAVHTSFGKKESGKKNPSTVPGASGSVH